MMRYKTHYDAIPRSLLQGWILDVGCGDRNNQRMSVHWDLLQKAKGIDISTGTDLFDFYPSAPYDTVLAIHIIEHIEIERWPELFDRLKKWTKPKGWLVVGCPYNQSPKVYKNYTGPEEQRHKVFNITSKLIDEYLPDTLQNIYQGPYSRSLLALWRKEQ